MTQIPKYFSFILFLFFLFWYFIFMSGHLGGDSFLNYLTTESLILEGNLAINDQPDREFQIPELRKNFQTVLDSPGQTPNGKVYSPYGIGMILIQVPFFIVGYLIAKVLPQIPQDYSTLFFVAMTNVFIISLICLLFYHLARLFKFNPSRSLYLTIALGICTFLFPFARQGFIEPLTILGIYTALFFLFRWQRQPKLYFIIIAGIAYGWAILTRFDCIMYFPFILGYIYYTKKTFRGKHEALVFSLLSAAAVFLVLCYNFFRFGNFLNFGYHGQFEEYLSFSPINILNNLYALLLSPGSALVFYAPVIGLAVFGIKPFLRRFTPEGILMGCIVIINILYICVLARFFNGGLVWGPRYNLLSIPTLVLVAGSGIDFIKRIRLRRYILVGVLVLGFLFQMPSVLVNSAQMTSRAITVIPLELVDFAPEYSPIVLGYYQICSAVTNAVAGHHLSIPVTYDTHAATLPFPRPLYDNAIPLEGVDEFDLWFIHVFRYDFVSNYLKIFTVIILLGMIVTTIILGRKLLRKIKELDLLVSGANFN